MQQKLLWRSLVVIFVTIVSLYYILPTLRVVYFKTTVPVPHRDTPEYTSYTKQLQQRQRGGLPLGALPVRFGLDLEGGTDVTVELDEEAAVRDQLAERSRDVRLALQGENVPATIKVDGQKRALVVAISRPEDARIARNVLKQYEQFEPWDEKEFEQGREVVLRLKPTEVTRYQRDTVDSARKVITNRVDALGLVQPVVVKEGERRIRVQMPGVADPEAVTSTIIRPAVLEFRLVHKENEKNIEGLFEPEEYKKVCDYIAQRKTLPDPLPLKASAEIPAGYILLPGEESDRERGTGLSKARYMPFLVQDPANLAGRRLRNAWVYMNTQGVGGLWEIHLLFDKQGAADFRTLTAEHVSERLAVALDRYVYSAPVIQEAIPLGRAQITGNFSQQEAVELSLVLKAGALLAPLKRVQSFVVEATLGADSIRKGLSALLAGSIGVAVFMIGYYGTAGAVSIVALAINVLLIVAILCLSGATLTLSGIGGILLTIGMAVDANVLIYERIREEKATARGLKAAVTRGFQRAFSVIYDSNLTTLIAILVLLQFGTGSVQGFALTTTFGIFATLFTGLFCTHILVDLWVQWRGKLGTGKIVLFRNPKVDFIGLRHFGYAVSGLILAVGIATTAAKGGLRPGVEFTGGLVADVRFEEQTSEGEIKDVVGRSFPTPVVQRVRGENRYLVRVSTRGLDSATTEGAGTQTAEGLLRKALAQHPAKADVGGVTSISPELGGEFIRTAIIAILISWVGILIYLAFRFELVFGAGAIVAVLHDVGVALGLVTLFDQDITLDVVAALLILIGYSV
ncbi:protein translocase subunit SecD, partial [Candidatus Sumerlaeota bacterium]|nr:protein translocase subunit SecD [Candidatus Sumerlaeota bacterium]